MSILELSELSAPLPPFPDGWYCIGLSRDLKNGEVQAHRFCGKELVVFRGQNGLATVADAHCPHLGAHLGHCGAVVGNEIRCPAHGYQYQSDGVCQKNGYGTPPPARARLRTYPVQEVNELLFFYYSQANRTPVWKLPQWNLMNWRALKAKQWTIETHVQDLQENGCDVGHFKYVHGYDEVRVIEAAKFEGPYLYAHYHFVRKQPFSTNPIVIDIHIHNYGLGYSYIDVNLESFGARFEQFVFYAPIDETTSRIMIAAGVRADTDLEKLPRIVQMLPKSLLLTLLNEVGFLAYQKDIKDDFKIWRYKKNMPHPAVSKGDGPLNQYRKYCRQFYPEYNDLSHNKLYVPSDVERISIRNNG